VAKMKAKQILIILCVVVIAILFNPVIHEFGHSLPPIVKGGGITRIVIFGYELVPDFGRRTHFGLAAYCTPRWPPNYTPTSFWLGLMAFSGSGLTLLVALISSLLLWIIKPKRTLRNIFLILSFYCFDILTYSFFTFGGLIHGSFSWRERAEPIEGLMLMGLSREASLAFVLIAVISVMTIVFLYLKKYPLEKIK
jgi:hypothetical protein